MSYASGVKVCGDGRGVIAPFGVVALRQLADRVGLPGLLSEAVHPHGGAHRVDRGGLFTDLAISLAVGGDCVDDFEVIRHVDYVLRPGQATTGSASLVRAEMKQFSQTKGRKVMRAVARARRRVWAHLTDDEGCLPASVVAGGKDVALGVVVLDVDATVVKTVSDQKEGAKGTFKGGVGYHPLTVWCDNTREVLVVKLRPGNAGSNTAGDHQDVFDQAMGQLPVRHRRHVLVRSDSAGGSKQFVTYLAGKNTRQRIVEYSVGMPVTQQVRDAITTVDARVWQSTVNSAGQASDVDESAVAELTDLLTYDGWPEGMRLIVRRERPHPGAQLDLFEEADGYRYTLFATNTTVGQLQQLEARHRAHARVENRIKDAKATGLATMPSKHWASNLAWTYAVMIATLLTRWYQLIGLTGTTLQHAQPKKLRHRLFGAAAQVVRSARQVRLKLSASWPWTKDLLDADTKVRAFTPLIT